eukprot:jgi/Mesen1/2277/ME000154S01446
MSPADAVPLNEVTSSAHADLGALKKFKDVLEGSGRQLQSSRVGDDFTLLRFLRAKRLDLTKAAEMYEAYLAWRDENKLDSIVESWEYPELEAVLDSWPQFWHKTDKEGQPVNYQMFGDLQVARLFEATSEERLMRQAMWVCEELYERKFPACSRLRGARVARATVVIDLANVSLFTFTSAAVRRVLLQMVHMLGSFYPESLGSLVIVNAPMAFTLVWDLLLPYLDERTQKKTQIHRDDGVESLLKIIDAENLPDFMGGSCECPNGCHLDGAGPWKE